VVLGSIAVALLLCCGPMLLGLLVAITSEVGVRSLGLAGAVAVAVLVLVSGVLARVAWYRVARWRVARWAQEGAWSLARRDRWPWTPHVTEPSDVSVVAALTRTIDEKQITVGELTWRRNALGNAAPSWDGRGVFAVVKLVHEAPLSAVRARREPRGPRPGEDEFHRRFTVLMTDPEFEARLDEHLRRAHVDGEVPPWNIVGDELFTIAALRGPLLPQHLERAVSGATRAVHLLGLDEHAG
jgi:hypothetical protein